MGGSAAGGSHGAGAEKAPDDYTAWAQQVNRGSWLVGKAEAGEENQSVPGPC